MFTDQELSNPDFLWLDAVGYARSITLNLVPNWRLSDLGILKQEERNEAIHP